MSRDLEDWKPLTWQELEEDLAEGENFAAPGGLLKLDAALAEEELRQLLQQKSTAPGIDVDSLFEAQHALHHIASELQAALCQVEKMDFCSAALTGAIRHGPLRPPDSSGYVTPRSSLTARYGPASRSTAPAPLQLALPAEATTLPDYQRRVSALPRSQFLDRQQPLTFASVDTYQDAKDMNRDELVVNGVHISGASGGYQFAVDQLAAGLRAGGAWPEQSDERAAQILLNLLGRTCSGFAAFEEVLRMFNAPDVVIVAPDSAAARPLEAVIVGGVALGRAHTRYLVRSMDGSGSALATVDADFMFWIDVDTLRPLTTQVQGEWPKGDGRVAVLLSRS